jgi:hypothetical protein
MLIWSRRQAGFFAQSSALITYLVSLNTDTFGIMISLRQEELNTETWRKQPAFDNLAIFLYSYSNQPGHPKYQPIQNNAISWLLFTAASNIFFCLK